MAKNQETDLRFENENILLNPYEQNPSVNGTSGASATTGKFGNCLDISGCTPKDFLWLDPTSAYVYQRCNSYSFWIKTSMTSAVCIIGTTLNIVSTRSCGTCLGGEDTRLYMDSSGYIHAPAIDDGTYTSAKSTTTINDGNWHHIVSNGGVGTTFDIWVDGVQEDSIAATVGANRNIRTTLGGGCLDDQWPDIGPSDDGFTVLDGQIDEFKAFTDVLNEQDVKRLMNNFDPLFLE